MIIPKFKAAVLEGKLVFEEPDLYEMWLGCLNNKKVEVVVRKPEKKRTDKQNAYYWAVLVRMIADDTGDDTESTHFFLKSLFLKDYKIVNRKRYTIVGSTKKLNTIKFEKYNNQIRKWAAEELNLSIPEPKEIEF